MDRNTDRRGQNRLDVAAQGFNDPFQPVPAWAYAWLGILVLATTAQAVLIPLYHAQQADVADSRHLILFLTGLVLAIDLPVSLYRFRAPELRQEYLRRWGIIDGLTVLAFVGPMMGAPLSQETLAADLLVLFGLLKLAKLAHIFSGLRLRLLRLANTLLLGFVLFWMALIVHWLVCGWMLIRGIPEGTTALNAYLDALYWTGTTVTTVGYGDIIPETRGQRMYALLTMVAGLAFLGYLVGMVASIWSRRDPGRLRFLENIEQLTHAVRATGLPSDLQRRIHRYYEYMWQERDWYDESGFLNTLPPGLREEASLHLRNDVLEKVDLFVGADPTFRRDIARHLRAEVVTPGGFLFREGDDGREMYFIVRGTVDVLIENETRVVNQMESGDFFGEIALFTTGPRLASIRAATFCDVYALSKAAFDRVAERHPESVAPIMTAARVRIQQRESLIPSPTAKAQPTTTTGVDTGGRAQEAD